MATFLFQWRRWAVWLCVGAVWLAAPGNAPAQEDEETEEPPAEQPQSGQDIEYRYAQELMRARLPEYAQMVIARLGGDPREQQLNLDLSLGKGDFKKAMAIIAARPDQDSEETWALKLSLADHHYAWNQFPEARAVYDAFFRRFSPNPASKIAEFYINSAHKYAQMLELMSQPKAAVDMYRNAIRATSQDIVKRQLLAEMAELMVKTAERNPAQAGGYIEDADKIASDLLWKQDIWFGKAIVIKAHVRLLRGDTKGAEKMVDEYSDVMVKIDDSLSEDAKRLNQPELEALSPMAQCRYLLGVMKQKEAEKILNGPPEKADKAKAEKLLLGDSDARGKHPGAIQHFVNVFARYPRSPWATDAGMHLQQCDIIMQQKFGRRIDYQLSPLQWAAVAKAQLQNSKALFNQQRWEAAADSYLKVLNLFPETDISPLALADVCRCYLELKNETYLNTVLWYLAERFGGRDESATSAGDQMLGLLQTFVEHKATGAVVRAQQLFTTHFSRHPRAVAMLFRTAEQQFKVANYPAALETYQQIATAYAGSPLKADALIRAAACYREMGQRDREIQTLDDYLKFHEPKAFKGQAYITVKYRLANAYREMGGENLPAALNRYIELIALLQGNRTPFERSEDDAKANRGILEAAMYFKAVGLSRLTPAEGRPENEYKTQAVQALQAFVAEFPKSEFLPRALLQLGTLWLALGNADEAKKAFDRLQKEHPNTPEAKDALYNSAKVLLEMGRRREAVEMLKRMFEAGGKYSTAQILTAGNELLKAGEYETAAMAFEKVLAASKERAYREPALAGRGTALIELGKIEEGVKVLDALLDEYKNTGHTVGACFALSKAYSALGEKETGELERMNRFRAAQKQLRIANRFLAARTNEAGVARTELEAGRVAMRYARLAQKGGGAATYADQRQNASGAFYSLILKGETVGKEGMVYLEEAYIEYIPLVLEIEHWADAKEACEQYLKLFPHGRALPAVASWLNKAEGGVQSDKARAQPAAAGATGQ